MISLAHLSQFYPEHLRHFKFNILREYLQYKILSLIFASKWKHQLAFMGGTSIRILYGLPRFSEDLDFDNLSMDEQGFKEMAAMLQHELQLEGYAARIECKFIKAFSATIKFDRLLFDLELSGHVEQLLKIKIDTAPQQFSYTPEQPLIQNFDVLCRIQAVPKDILLAQKFFAILNRKRVMGRDFYDIFFLAPTVKPNKEYLLTKTGLATMTEVKNALLERCQDLPLSQMEQDLEPFVFAAKDVSRIALFPDWLESQEFS